jgi:hypothetical protein
MPSAGMYRWECVMSAGPRPRRVPLRKTLPDDFIPDSGRARMGPRPPPFQHMANCDAKRKRDERVESPPSYLAVISQLKVAKIRVRTGRGQNPNRAALLARFVRRSRNYDVGDEVSFINPSSRKNYVEAPTKGHVLCFPDKQRHFVAVDRSRTDHRRKLLSHIEVVPCTDAWL